jgi:hypothetical protein
MHISVCSILTKMGLKASKTKSKSPFKPNYVTVVAKPTNRLEKTMKQENATVDETATAEGCVTNEKKFISINPKANGSTSTGAVLYGMKKLLAEN